MTPATEAALRRELLQDYIATWGFMQMYCDSLTEAEAAPIVAKLRAARKMLDNWEKNDERIRASTI